MKIKFSALLLFVLTAVMLVAVPVSASTPTDRIDQYTIYVDVNENATVNINYHIEWTVLESDSVGPVSWLKIGIPNTHAYDIFEESDNISYINREGSYVEVHFKDEYYEGETVSFDFRLTQDYMYQVNKLKEGYTVYSFTPGWFDEVPVENLTISWSDEKADSFTPDCLMDNGRYVWTTSLAPGEKYTVSVSYPNDAYQFDLSYDAEEEKKTSFAEILGGIIGVIFIMTFVCGSFALPFLIPYLVMRGFNPKTIKKIERKKVVYFDSCPGCGAVRKDGASECEYCGKSMIQSEEILKEDEIKDTDKDILKMKTDGLYSYKSSPNTFISVHTTRVANPSYKSFVSSGRSGGHSCAHSSCACACACACAGGGRAGCTNKDFYNTNLKLKYLKRKSESKS